VSALYCWSQTGFSNLTCILVHILSGDLILHKRTLEPIKTLVYGLRRYDLDRCAALVDQSTADPNVKVVGYMSHKAKIYLADVHDHMGALVYARRNFPAD
jgi:hypothetical protein